MKEMGLSDSEINQLGALDTNTVYEQSTNDENGDGVVNENDQIAIKYQNNDFIHMCGSIAVQLNPDVSFAASIGTEWKQDKYSNYEGDAASGSFGFADVRANTDAYNIARRIQEGNLDPFAVLDGYADDVLNQGVNPAEEFIEHYEYDDSLLVGDGDYSFKEKKAQFDTDVRHRDDTMATDILVGRGTEKGNKTPDDYIDYFNHILEGNLTPPDENKKQKLHR